MYCAYGTGRVDLLNCSFFSNKKDVTISNMATSKTGTFIYSESAGSLKLVNTSMMSINMMDKLIGKIPFIHFVISAYNFHVQSINESLGCPFVGLTVVTKELLLSGTVFLTMANLFLIYGVDHVFNVVMGKEKPSLIH